MIRIPGPHDNPAFLDPGMRVKCRKGKINDKVSGQIYPDTSLPKFINAEGKNHQNIGKNNRKRLLVTVPDSTYQHSDVSTHTGP